MFLMLARASRVSKTCLSRASNSAAATGRLDAAPAVVAVPVVMPWAREPSMTLAIPGPSRCWSRFPAIAASTVAIASPVTSPTWLCPTANTRAASSNGLFVWSPKTVCPTKPPVGTFGATTVSSFPTPPFKTGWRPLGKKKRESLWTTYLNEALATFSGYLTIDELYDGPFCVVSIVDNRTYKRLVFRVLDHKPTSKDMRGFLSEFKAQLDKRGLKVRGITTDDSPLYPKVLKKLWPDVPHQRCRFHVLMEIVKAVLHALAKIRKVMKAKIPKFKRGHPRKEQQALVRRLKRRKQRLAELFKHRHLFVRHHLSTAQKKVLKKLLRGQRQLRTLRQIMDEVYRLFDRRCKTQTARGRLEKLRKRVRRFIGLRRTLARLFSPNLEKALLFLDDKLLGSTSNAVERSNRRFRKAQKSIYNVRTKEHIEERLALDMERERRALKRQQTGKTLHRGRSMPDSLH
jgi:hypothetical protein